MFKRVFHESVTVLLKHPKIIRLGVFSLIFFSLVRIYYLVYYTNNLLLMKYESGVNYSDALLYLIESIGSGKGLVFVIIIVLLVIIGYLRLYPIGQASVVYALEDTKRSAVSSFFRGGRKFFPLLEYNGLSLSFGLFTFLTIVLRFFLMDILGNAFVIILVSIR